MRHKIYFVPRRASPIKAKPPKEAAISQQSTTPGQYTGAPLAEAPVKNERLKRNIVAAPPRPIASVIPPAILSRCDLLGWPQFGQAVAVRDMGTPHALHGSRFIGTAYIKRSPYVITFRPNLALCPVPTEDFLSAGRRSLSGSN